MKYNNGLPTFHRAANQVYSNYQSEQNSHFLTHTAQARQSLREGKGIRMEDLPDTFWSEENETTAEAA